MNKMTYYSRGIAALLLFVLLGYTVKFYPDQLTAFDSTIQNLVRGDLPAWATTFFKSITVLGNTSSQVVWIALFAGYFFFGKNWRAESCLVLTSGSLAGGLILLLKNLYARPRPAIEWLIEEHGFSFPSGHTTGAMMIFGALLIVLIQRMDKSKLKQALQFLLVGLIVLIPLSRIYLGVHYPTDIIGGLSLGYGVLNLIYPTYMQLRFKWRFKGWSK